MKVKQIISANPDFKKENAGENSLQIAEFFCDTIQGEGINMGQPATFLRLQYCTLNCVWCDTKEVWRFGNPYSFEELFDLMEKNEVIDRFIKGQHLVITGGSPLRQQTRLIAFIHAFQYRYAFTPYIEIENECTLMPEAQIISFVKCWNNSPKLQSSENSFESRYKPEVLKKLSSLQNSWFKFVVSSDRDWEEIVENYIEPELIDISQIILMPRGATREELQQNREIVLDIAIENNVRYSTREHIVIWDKKTGI
jgi:7-carboxy-7-deazaguanine synthase